MGRDPRGDGHRDLPAGEIHAESGEYRRDERHRHAHSHHRLAASLAHPVCVSNCVHSIEFGGRK